MLENEKNISHKLVNSFCLKYIEFGAYFLTRKSMEAGAFTQFCGAEEKKKQLSWKKSVIRIFAICCPNLDIYILVPHLGRVCTASPGER